MDAYKASTALNKLTLSQEATKPLRLAFLDLDGTWAGRPADQQAVRDVLESRGYVICPTTSRTAEMCMSKSERKKTALFTSSRPLVDTPDAPEDMPEFRGLLDCDMLIAASGTRLLLKQRPGGYRPDETFERRLPASPAAWHAGVDRLLAQAAAAGYEYAVSRIAPNNFRVEVRCSAPEPAEQLLGWLAADPAADAIHIARETSNLFITPASCNKESAANHFVNHIQTLLNIRPAALHVLLAGDSHLDLPMGLTSAPGTQAVFLIPGGSPLASATSLKELKESRILYPDRPVIMGGETFPGTKGPETLLAWFNSVA